MDKTNSMTIIIAMPILIKGIYKFIKRDTSLWHGSTPELTTSLYSSTLSSPKVSHSDFTNAVTEVIQDFLNRFL
jgi:hypothetical protein